MKVVRLSALRTDRLYPPGNIPGTHFCYRLSQSQGHSATGRIMSKKNSNDTIGNRTRDLPACRAVPQPTGPQRAPSVHGTVRIWHRVICPPSSSSRSNKRFLVWQLLQHDLPPVSARQKMRNFIVQWHCRSYLVEH